VHLDVVLVNLQSMLLCVEQSDGQERYCHQVCDGLSIHSGQKFRKTSRRTKIDCEHFQNASTIVILQKMVHFMAMPMHSKCGNDMLYHELVTQFFAHYYVMIALIAFPASSVGKILYVSDYKLASNSYRLSGSKLSNTIIPSCDITKCVSIYAWQAWGKNFLFGVFFGIFSIAKRLKKVVKVYFL
jgi:hypothetical protein